jgi:hypothetical protein
MSSISGFASAESYSYHRGTCSSWTINLPDDGDPISLNEGLRKYKIPRIIAATIALMASACKHDDGKRVRQLRGDRQNLCVLTAFESGTMIEQEIMKH